MSASNVKKILNVFWKVLSFSLQTASNTKKLVPKVCTRALRKKKLKKAPQQHPATQVNSEAQTVVETLHTQSVVDVVCKVNLVKLYEAMGW